LEGAGFALVLGLLMWLLFLGAWHGTAAVCRLGTRPRRSRDDRDDRNNHRDHRRRTEPRIGLH
jgi:hypothetical protein